MDEMDGWLENLSEMMSRQEDRATESKAESKKTKDRIDTVV